MRAAGGLDEDDESDAAAAAFEATEAAAEARFDAAKVMDAIYCNVV